MLKTMPAAILILVIFSGCSQDSKPDAARTGNANLTVAAANNNNVSVNPPNTPTSIVNNTSTQIVNKNTKSLPPVEEPTPQIGSGGQDMLLLTQVRGALSSDKELINTVIVDLKEGNATLTGNVSSEAQKVKAAQLVQSVKGIKSVKNNLRVSS